MQAIEFLQGLGWITVAAYCLNNLGLVPPSWIDAVQSRAGISPTAVSSPSPSSSPKATPSPTASSQESVSDDPQFSTQP
jgi:hypothetical protein